VTVRGQSIVTGPFGTLNYDQRQPLLFGTAITVASSSTASLEEHRGHDFVNWTGAPK
jgi:hypothetical protein